MKTLISYRIHKENFDGYKRTTYVHTVKTHTGIKEVEYWKPKKLLGLNSSAKTAKGKMDIYILYLRPADGNTLGVNLCPHATKECSEACLGNTAGRMRMSNVQKYQNNKTLFYLLDRKGFYNILQRDINRAKKRAQRTGIPFAVRLNGTTDISFRKFIAMNSDVQFYDYTKNAKRAKTNNLSNYHLTLSFSGYNWLDCIDYLDNGGNVAVVFNADKLPKIYKGYLVINADKSDARYQDPKGCISGLTVKGKGHNFNDNPFFVTL